MEGKRHSPRAILWRREGREADRRGEGEGPTVAGGGGDGAATGAGVGRLGGDWRGR